MAVSTAALAARAWLLCFGIAMFTAGVSIAHAVNLDAQVTFDIPAGPLSSALIEFSKQAHVQVLSSGDRTKAASTEGLSGTFTIREALTRLLKISGLRFKSVSTDVLAIESEAKDGTRVDKAPSSIDTQSESTALEEITVTATRRSESISRVPISIEAFDQARLDNLSVKDMQDIGDLTPGVNFKPYFEDTTLLSIRGIYSVIGTATTGVYIDDTPVQVRVVGAGSQSTNIYPAVFDLERVEVLRGPQGTLFGAGSEGGNIRFITPQPSLTDYSGHARTEFGFTENGAPSYELGAAVGGPIVDDHLGFRVSAYDREEGGYIDRVPFPGDAVTARNINSNSTRVLNAAFAFSPFSALTITPGVYYQRQHREDTSQYFAYLSNPSEEVFQQGYSIPQPETEMFTLPSIKVQWDLGGASFFSNSSYLNRTRDSVGDYSLLMNEILSGTYVAPGNIVAPSPTYFDNPQRTFTQEVRLQSTDDSARVSWTIGAFYQGSRQNAGEFIYSPDLGDATEAIAGKTVAQAFGVGLLPGGLAYYGIDTSHDTQMALFGQTDIKITSALTGVVGLRFTKDKSSFTNAQGGAFNGGPTSAVGGESETATTPKFGLNYRLERDWMLYASAAQGFRPGGGNPPVSPTRCAADLESLGLTSAPLSYKSDSVWSYEIGSKSRSENDRLDLSASIYYIRWSNIQQRILLQKCGFQYAGNEGVAVSKGFDLQGSVQPISNLPGLRLGTSLGYDNAKYTQNVYGSLLPSGVPAVIVSADDLLNTAPWQVVGTVDYTFTPAADYQGYFHWDYSYSSPYDTFNPRDVGWDPAVFNVSQERISSARLGYKHNGWDVSLFAKNLFDSHDILWVRHTVIASPLIQPETFRPRTVGVTASLKF
jgi:iron complex outermembrane recepter protein